MDRKARIAHLAGPNATIQNTPPLVTSNKARAKHNLFGKSLCSRVEFRSLARSASVIDRSL
jgi:hypothetical protein